MRTEGDGRSVREGGFSSFRTQPFPQGRTFLCVASCVGDVLGVRTFIVLFQELERLHRFVIHSTVTYVRLHLKLPRLAGCATKELGGNAVPRVVGINIICRGCVRPVSAFKTSKRIALC